MVADPRLRDDCNVAAEGTVPALEQQNVFFRRQIHIGFTVDRDNRNSGGGDRPQVIDGIRRVRQRLLFGEAVDLLSRTSPPCSNMR